jgi:hypothetical protein
MIHAYRFTVLPEYIVSCTKHGNVLFVTLTTMISCPVTTKMFGDKETSKVWGTLHRI